MVKTLLLSLLTLSMSISPLTAAAAVPTVKLEVPIYRQEKRLSCEAVDLKMALEFKGVSPISEDQMMALMGVDASQRNGNTWGDPDLVYVGDVSGAQNKTGYGVHWDPVARAAQNFRAESYAFSGWSVQRLAEEITAGNPIIIWGVYGKRPRKDSWVTPEGKTVHAWVGEHSRVVVGFTGSVDNPQTFILNDSLVGQIRWSTKRLKSDWATFGNSGVVVK